MPVRVVDERKRREPAVDVEALRAQCGRTLDLAGLSHNSFGLALIDDARMSDYNRQYRGKEGPTNVLSFPAAHRDAAEAANLPPAVRADMGDVLISVDTALREAESQKMPLERRLAELMLHGLLHLAGYDHERSEAEAVVMWDKERRLFAQLGESARQFTMPRLSVNIGPIAALRDAGTSGEPDPVLVAGICELAGADGITARLRDNGGHSHERDLRLLRETVKAHLNLEMAAMRDCLDIALDLRPDMVTLAPEHFRGSAGLKRQTAPLARALAEVGIEVALLVAPDDRQIATAAELGATHVQLHTGRYAGAPDAGGRERELVLLRRAAELALEQGLRVRAGRGLDCRNLGPVAALPGVETLVIGQALAARALFTGLDRATREMLAAIREGAAMAERQCGMREETR